MAREHIDNISVNTKANVYFGGKCVSHSITLADGTKKSVGVILPAELHFSTASAEVMECVAGGCEYRLDGTENWLPSGPGEQFSVVANSGFDIRVAEAYHYICHFA